MHEDTHRRAQKTHRRTQTNADAHKRAHADGARQKQSKLCSLCGQTQPLSHIPTLDIC